MSLSLIETWNVSIFFSTRVQTSTERTVLAGLLHFLEWLDGDFVHFFQSHLNNVLILVCFSRTPLHYAAANCNHQCLFALVGSGASVNDLDERGCTPLHYAAASDTDGKLVTISSS